MLFWSAVTLFGLLCFYSLQPFADSRHIDHLHFFSSLPVVIAVAL